MYLSQLVFDPRSRDGLRDLSDAYQLHRTIMSGFHEKLSAEERVLYRVELGLGNLAAAILVQSFQRPDWARLEARSCLLRPPAVKPFEIEPVVGELFRFRLTANPTKRLKGNFAGEGKADGKRVGLVREEDQLAWLNRKAAQNGFGVLSAQTTKTTQPEGWKSDGAGQVYRIHCQGVQFDGLLEVQDAVLFHKALSGGIGSGKGFGFGLLSLAHI